MFGLGPNCLCARWKRPGCWPAASSAWDLHLAQEAPALICPGQVACYVDAVLFLRSHAGVVENGFPFGLIPPLLYLSIGLPSESLITPSAPQICSDRILRFEQIKEIPELWKLQEDLWHQSTAALLSRELLTRKQIEELSFPSESQKESAFTYSPASYLAFSPAGPWTAITSTLGIAINSDDCPGM